ELRTIAVGPTLQADRSAPLSVRCRHRFALPQAAIEADREASRRILAYRAGHPHDTVDMSHKGLGPLLPVPHAQNTQLDRSACAAERVLECCRRDEPSAAFGVLEEQSVRWAVDGEAARRAGARR